MIDAIEKMFIETTAELLASLRFQELHRGLFTPITASPGENTLALFLARPENKKFASLRSYKTILEEGEAELTKVGREKELLEILLTSDPSDKPENLQSTFAEYLIELPSTRKKLQKLLINPSNNFFEAIEAFSQFITLKHKVDKILSALRTHPGLRTLITRELTKRSPDEFWSWIDENDEGASRSMFSSILEIFSEMPPTQQSSITDTLKIADRLHELRNLLKFAPQFTDALYLLIQNDALLTCCNHLGFIIYAYNLLVNPDIAELFGDSGLEKTSFKLWLNSHDAKIHKSTIEACSEQLKKALTGQEYIQLFDALFGRGAYSMHTTVKMDHVRLQNHLLKHPDRAKATANAMIATPQAAKAYTSWKRRFHIRRRDSASTCFEPGTPRVFQLAGPAAPIERDTLLRAEPLNA